MKKSNCKFFKDMGCINPCRKYTRGNKIKICPILKVPYQDRVWDKSVKKKCKYYKKECNDRRGDD